MISFRKQQIGMTLFEVILVLVIGGGLLLLSLRQYESFRFDANIQQTRQNVDTLFQAAAMYYQANCIIHRNPTDHQIIAGTGKLDPINAPANPFALNIKTDLVDTGFLTALPLTPLVDNSHGSYGGYVVQFNQVDPPPDRSVEISPSGTQSIGKIIVWRIQVSVLLLDPTKASAYLPLLQGDCLADLTGTTVGVCSTGSATGTKYVVWERLPSFASPLATSDYWIANPTVKQFNQMYTTYPILDLTNGFKTAEQNYLCGS